VTPARRPPKRPGGAERVRGEEYVFIGVVARRFGVHPQTLRLYEREGLIQPARSTGHTRLYDRDTVERLEMILTLTRDLGVNLAGVEVILDLRSRLSRMEGEAVSLKKEKISKALLTGYETVLIVEDNDALRKLAVKILGSQGYTVLNAQNGEEALRIGKEHKGPIHLLLTDVVMPGMSGWDLGKRLRPMRPEMKVIYMSGYTYNAILQHGVLDPQLSFLQKPFTVADLGRKVRKVLDQRIED
jgi:DNA-binding transcriptional MerR regulator